MFPWIRKCVSATLPSGRYTLSYLSWRVRRDTLYRLSVDNACSPHFLANRHTPAWRGAASAALVGSESVRKPGGSPQSLSHHPDQDRGQHHDDQQEDRPADVDVQRAGGAASRIILSWNTNVARHNNLLTVKHNLKFHFKYKQANTRHWLHDVSLGLEGTKLLLYTPWRPLVQFCTF